MVTVYDQATEKTLRQPKTEPVLVNDTYNGKRYEKEPDDSDFEFHCSEIDRMMCESMEQITQTVPIETEYAVASCWSKSAKLLKDNRGRIKVWAP